MAADAGWVGRMELEMAPAVAGSPARRGMQGMKASAVKTAGMKAAPGVKATAATVETTASVEAATAATSMEAAATAAMEAAAAPTTATGCLCQVCEHQP